MEQYRGTTIVSVRRGNKVVIGGDGQVSQGNTVMKGNARKVRRLYKDQVIAGFVGEFGERIFVTPPAEGFNLMVWFMPIFGILIGGYAVRVVLRGWSRDAVRPAIAAGATLSDTDRNKLDSALKERDV